MTKILHLIEKEKNFAMLARGEFESLAWDLAADDETAEFVAFHRAKGDFAWFGGKILGIRDATDEEMEARPHLKASSRKVIHFQILPEYRKQGMVRWAGKKTPGVTYKSLEITE